MRKIHTTRPMLATAVQDQQRNIPRRGHYGYAAPAIRAPAAEVVVLVLVQVRVEKKEQRVRVGGEDGDRGVIFESSA